MKLGRELVLCCWSTSCGELPQRHYVLGHEMLGVRSRSASGDLKLEGSFPFRERPFQFLHSLGTGGCQIV